MASSFHTDLRSSAAPKWRALGIFVLIALAGCEGSVTLDVGTTQPGRTVSEVWVDVTGVEFSGGGTQRLEFDEPVRVNLVDFNEGNLFRLFTDEELDDGRYTGARLLFEDDASDDDDYVAVTTGEEFDLTVMAGTAADVAFTVDKDDSSREDVVLTLDLRQSLSFDDDANEEVFTLTPVLRGVRTEDSGRITGSITAACPPGTSLAEGGAVYLFSGRDREPDDRDGAEEEAYLTAAAIVDGSATSARYSFEYVPEGDYTLALTCDADEEDAATDDDVRFQDAVNVTVRAEQTLTRDLD